MVRNRFFVLPPVSYCDLDRLDLYKEVLFPVISPSFVRLSVSLKNLDSCETIKILSLFYDFVQEIFTP